MENELAIYLWLFGHGRSAALDLHIETGEIECTRSMGGRKEGRDYPPAPLWDGFVRVAIYLDGKVLQPKTPLAMACNTWLASMGMPSWQGQEAEPVSSTSPGSLMERAIARRYIETDPVRRTWWTGYIYGLRRARSHPGFAAHEIFGAAIESGDERQAALGRGYVVGMSRKEAEPD